LVDSIRGQPILGKQKAGEASDMAMAQWSPQPFVRGGIKPAVVA
jgi:hypothetical protein